MFGFEHVNVLFFNFWYLFEFFFYFVVIFYFVFKTSARSPAMVAYSVCCTINSFSWITLFCYYANSTTDRIADLSQAAYNSNWMEWSPELQKYIILIMRRSQEPVYFNGLGLIYCTLETFGKVRMIHRYLLHIFWDCFFFFVSAAQSFVFLLLDIQKRFTKLKCSINFG